MPNYKLFKEEKDFDFFIKQEPMSETRNIREDNSTNYYVYELTQTFAQSYWTLNRAVDYGIAQILAVIVKYLNYKSDLTYWSLEYVVEYHKSGYPHMHAQLFTREELDPNKQRNLCNQLRNRFGRIDWYQTGREDKIHKKKILPLDVEVEMRWSEYIRKDLVINNSNGCNHGYIISKN